MSVDIEALKRQLKDEHDALTQAYLDTQAKLSEVQATAKVAKTQLQDFRSANNKLLAALED